MKKRLQIIGKCIKDDDPVWVHELYAIAWRLADEREKSKTVKKKSVR